MKIIVVPTQKFLHYVQRAEVVSEVEPPSPLILGGLARNLLSHFVLYSLCMVVLSGDAAFQGAVAKLYDICI